jgi:hypothetical protein
MGDSLVYRRFHELFPEDEALQRADCERLEGLPQELFELLGKEHDLIVMEILLHFLLELEGVLEALLEPVRQHDLQTLLCHLGVLVELEDLLSGLHRVSAHLLLAAHVPQVALLGLFLLFLLVCCSSDPLQCLL